MMKECKNYTILIKKANKTKYNYRLNKKIKLKNNNYFKINYK